MKTTIDALVEALEGFSAIEVYGIDTLSGRTDGPDDRDWQRAAVSEMVKRAKVSMWHLRAAIAQARAEQAEPVAWLVCSVNKDGSLSLEHAAAWQEAAHAHINDAITEHDIQDAARWVVRPAYTAPPAAPVAKLESIETSPNDGSRHIAWSKEHGFCIRCEPPGCFAGEWSLVDGSWRGHAERSCMEATHWMPLPPPPVEAAHNAKLSK